MVKIFDFGLVRFTQQIGAGSDHRALTNTQSMLGTPLYMAPEQAKGGGDSAPIGPPADIWAIGMLCFELLTGKTYFGWDSLLQFIGQLLFSDLAPPSQRDATLPPAFDAWFARSCHRNPSERFASAGAQMAELAQALGCDSANLSAATLIGLRETIKNSEAKLQPVIDGTPKDTRVISPPHPPTLGSIPTMAGAIEVQTLGSTPTLHAPNELTLGSTPTLHASNEPTLGSTPTLHASNEPTLGSAPTLMQPEHVAVEAPPVAVAKPRTRRGWWFAVGGAALLGLSLFFLLKTPNSANHPQPMPRTPIDLAAKEVLETPPVIVPDLAVVAPHDMAPRDMAPPVETFVPIPELTPHDLPPPRKLHKPFDAGKRFPRPPDKRVLPPPVPQKPPEEYVHPTL